MNTFWLKIAGIALVAVIVVALIGVLSPPQKSQPAVEPAPEPRQKTFQDQVEEDKKKFLAEPKPAKQQEQKQSANERTSAKPARPTILYFKPLDEIDKAQAEQLLNEGAVPGRSIGRLPWTGFKLMVVSCRRIISKWPDSWYAYRAKQMLADMPVRFRERYKITEEELDISKFTKQRPGTEPFTVEDSR